MPYGSYWVIEYHTRPCPTHHCTYFLTHSWLIAMYRTALACRLVLTELTPSEPHVGIPHQFAVFIGKFSKPQFMPAIQLHHSGNNTFLAFNPVHSDKISTMFPITRHLFENIFTCCKKIEVNFMFLTRLSLYLRNN